jgi:hypothetical protein
MAGLSSDDGVVAVGPLGVAAEVIGEGTGSQADEHVRRVELSSAQELSLSRSRPAALVDDDHVVLEVHAVVFVAVGKERSRVWRRASRTPPSRNEFMS